MDREKDSKIDIKSKSIEEIEEIVASLGGEKFRAKQIFHWIHKGVKNFYEMKNIPKGLLEKLDENCEIKTLELEALQVSMEDGTRKYLFKLGDGSYIESVFMKYKYGNTLCVSTQIGCRMGCVFCASTMDGLVRNLLASEIISQLYEVERDVGEKINHIVVMGMGEPFDNYENLKRFIDIIANPNGRNLSKRNITVSTCGLVPKIEKFAEDFPQVNLAISLHEPDNDSRSQLMPINRSYDLEELIKACKNYTEKTNRRITFEYTLVAGKNDSNEKIEKLINLVKGLLCHINLIPLNYVDEIGIKGSHRKRTLEIAKILEKNHIPATVRRQLGNDISGACGQLRLHNIK